MSKKVFISHASADEKMVSLFVDHILVAGSGVKLEDIFYTTRVDTGVANGDDIPSAIKNGIRGCNLFVMMVSDHYRNSEVCLNEMGAAIMRDDLPIMILLLPNVDFDRLGWLVSLKKGTKLTESDGLDQIHDQIMELMSVHVKTATWNRSKTCFLSHAQEAEEKGNSLIPESVQRQEEEELDFLDIRERFSKHTKEYTDILGLYAEAMSDYNERLGIMTRRLNQIRSNPKTLTPRQVRGVFLTGALETDKVSALYEEKTPLFRYHFDKSIEYAEMLQSTANEAVKEDNKKQFKTFVDSMVSTRDILVDFRKTLDGMVDLDKHFKKSRVRLMEAMDNMLDVVSFCISRASVLL